MVTRADFGQGFGTMANSLTKIGDKKCLQDYVGQGRQVFLYAGPTDIRLIDHPEKGLEICVGYCVCTGYCNSFGSRHVSYFFSDGKCVGSTDMRVGISDGVPMPDDLWKIVAESLKKNSLWAYFAKKAGYKGDK